MNRHLRENHKGVRPYACTLCDKKYGRRDYLQRHLKSHNANYAVNLQSASHINASQVVQKVQVQPQNTKPANTIILQQGQGGAIQVRVQARYFNVGLKLILFLGCFKSASNYKPTLSPLP